MVYVRNNWQCNNNIIHYTSMSSIHMEYKYFRAAEFFDCSRQQCTDIWSVINEVCASSHFMCIVCSSNPKSCYRLICMSLLTASHKTHFQSNMHTRTIISYNNTNRVYIMIQFPKLLFTIFHLKLIDRCTNMCVYKQ